MTFVCLGKIALPTPGTPVPLSTDPTQTAHCIVVSQVPGGAGTVYLKNIKGGNGPSGVIVRAFVQTGTTGFLDEHRLDGDCQIDPLYPADWAIDAATTNDGMNVYWVTE
jgi:hypothetical protein